MSIDRKRIIGLDPGKKGGIAVIEELRTVAMGIPEDDAELFAILSGFPPSVAILEQVGATPQMPSVSSFTFGHGFGRLKMAAIAAGHEVHLVRPQKWKTAFGLIVHGRSLGRNDTEKKNLDKQKAQELFPHIRITHYTADALLLAKYGERFIA